MSKTTENTFDVTESSKDSAAETKSTSSNHGLWLVVGLNAALFVVGISITAAYSAFDYSEDTFDWTLWFEVLQFGVLTAAIAPMFVASAVAAWGPWSVWKRAGLLMAVSVVSAALTYSQQNMFLPVVTNDYRVWSFLSTFINYVAIFSSATLCMTFVGSMMKLRLGEEGLPPVRISILGIMACTALLGILIPLTSYVDSKSFEARIQAYEEFDYDTIETGIDQNQFRQTALQTVLAFGPIIGLVILLTAACRYRWIPRIVLLLLIAGCGVLFVSQLGGRMSDAQMTIVLTSIISSLLIIAVWLPICLLCLERSGWYLKRRHPTKPASSQQ